MIYGQLHNELVEKMIQTTLYKFYLTGSRFFGHMTKESDYDFFVERIPGVETWLLQHDFHEETEPVYNDAFKCVVYRNWRFDIHVQVINNVEAKRKAQDMLKNFPWVHVTKENQKHIWNWAFMQVK